MVSGIVVWSLVHFKFTFVYGIRKLLSKELLSNLVASHIVVQYSPAPLSEESVFSPLHSLASLS